MNFRKRFGLLSAGIGAFMSSIALVTGTLDGVQIISSSVLVAFGLILYFTG